MYRRLQGDVRFALRRVMVLRCCIVVLRRITLLRCCIVVLRRVMVLRYCIVVLHRVTLLRCCIVVLRRVALLRCCIVVLRRVMVLRYCIVVLRRVTLLRCILLLFLPFPVLLFLFSFPHLVFVPTLWRNHNESISPIPHSRVICTLTKDLWDCFALRNIRDKAYGNGPFCAAGFSATAHSLHVLRASYPALFQVIPGGTSVGARWCTGTLQMRLVERSTSPMT